VLDLKVFAGARSFFAGRGVLDLKVFAGARSLFIRVGPRAPRFGLTPAF
jgi:hypothetical protein